MEILIKTVFLFFYAIYIFNWVLLDMIKNKEYFENLKDIVDFFKAFIEQLRCKKRELFNQV